MGEWTTSNEIKYLTRIGSHSTWLGRGVLGGDMPRREELLRRYIESSKNRKVWLPLDREKILNFAINALKREERKRKRKEK